MSDDEANTRISSSFWLRALTVETKIVDVRPSRSRPGYGIIRLRNVTTNQRGEIVQTMLASAMVPMRKS